VAKGNNPVTLVDDVVTDTRHSIPVDTAVLLVGSGREWEPSRLQKQGPISAAGASEEKEWEPSNLPLRKVSTFAVDLDGDLPEQAVQSIRSGEEVKLRMPHTDELRLSDLSGLPEAARDSGGSLILELHADG
jgi:hypothetical protein